MISAGDNVWMVECVHVVTAQTTRRSHTGGEPTDNCPATSPIEFLVVNPTLSSSLKSLSRETCMANIADEHRAVVDAFAYLTADITAAPAEADAQRLRSV